MRVFVAGATGVIGRSLVPRLVEKGHTVTAMTRRPDRKSHLAAMGAEPVVCDVYDPEGLEDAVRRARPEVVVHQLTALPQAIDPRKIEEQLAANDRIRVEGTKNLMRAAVRAGARRVVAQSIAFAYAPEGGSIKPEEAPLWLAAPWPWRRSVEAVAELERRVSSTGAVEGVVLRYGYLYGPGTAYATDGSVATLVRKRQFPIAGAGSGVFSFVHVDDAARATVAAIEGGDIGIYNVVDDEPASLRDWLPAYAHALGAKPPRRVFAWLARLAAGSYGLYSMTEQRGASNLRAKQELGWRPRLATWRTGFGAALCAETGREARVGEPAMATGG